MIFNKIHELKESKKTFLTLKKEKVSYENFRKRIEAICVLVKSKGIRKGDKILLSVTYDYDTISLFIAFLSLGITTILLDPKFKKQKAITIINNLDFDGWVVDSKLEKEWELTKNKKISFGIEPNSAKKENIINKLLKKKTTVVERNNTLESLIQGESTEVRFAQIEKDKTAYILFTSGSSAKPKGVKISYGNMLSHLKTLSTQYELNSDSQILNILPIYHTDGLIQGPILTFYNGASLLRPFEFEIGKIPELFDGIYKYRVTHFFTVPTMIAMLYKLSTNYEDSFVTDDFKHIISSASVLENQLWKNFEMKFNVLITNVYGLTETVAGSLFCGPDESTRKRGSIGKPVDCEAKLIDEKNVEIKQFSKVGELVLKGDHITKSYLKKDNVLVDGWFHTGDLAYKDNDNFYYISGRKSNMIISGGVNISPEEIQEILNANSGIEESYVYGVKDNTWGERVEAAIVLIPGNKLKIEELNTYCAEFLESNKIPSSFYFVQEIPKTMSGKLDKEALIKVIEEHKGNTNETQINLQEKIVKLASSAFNLPENKVDIYAHSKAIDGWTSLNHLDFIVKIEEVFKVNFSTSEIMIITTINDAIKLTGVKVQTS